LYTVYQGRLAIRQNKNRWYQSGKFWKLSALDAHQLAAQPNSSAIFSRRAVLGSAPSKGIIAN
jgi:hypothetical protein